jgi:hypothetical protein
MPDLKCGNCHYEIFVPQHVFEARGGSENIDCPGCRNLGMNVVIKEASGSVTISENKGFNPVSVSSETPVSGGLGETDLTQQDEAPENPEDPPATKKGSKRATSRR